MSRSRRQRTALLGGLLAFALPGLIAAAPATTQVELLVRPATTVAAVTADLDRLGGELLASHDAVGLLHVRLPQNAVASLEADSDVAGLSPADAVTFAADSSSRRTVGVPVAIAADSIGADKFTGNGIDGAGIDIAVIDTGIADHPALAGRVVKGPDLSFDGRNPELAGTDGYGHGTHLAGIMVGKTDGLQGIAPGARLVDVRVGDSGGAADVSQVIAALDWTIANAHTDGRNIRVVNLAFGTPSAQHWSIDPLAYAVEAAWRSGLVVVTAVGNDGSAGKGVMNPATHPLVLAVGATDTLGTTSTKDDVMASFSQEGTAARSADIVAPGASLLSVVPQGSTLARQYPDAFRNGLFVGSGTSQATAVVSASVALLLQAHPRLTPDEVKAALRSTGKDIAPGETLDGAGRMNVDKAYKDAGGAWGAVQTVRSADGSGSLEASRGGRNVELVLEDGSTVLLEGETTFTGSEWSGEAWAGSNWQGSNWQGSNWQGSNWQGSNWQGSNWQGSNWQGSNWQGSNWQGSNWQGSNWMSSLWG